MRITIDGNIGSGKTSLMKTLQDWSTRRLDPSAFRWNIDCHYEPVEWWSSKETDHLLAKQYADPTRWSLTCQLMIAASHATIYRDDSTNCRDDCTIASKQSLTIVERSAVGNKLFAQKAMELGWMTAGEWVIYNHVT